MKNWEKYEKEIKELGIDNFAVTETGEVKPCNDIGCHECIFSDTDDVSEYSCSKVQINWLYEEYKEPPKVDWSKIPVDTPIYVRDYERNEWVPRHFAKYEDGEVYAWRGMTTFTGGHIPIEAWTYAKLANDFNSTGDKSSDE